MDQLVGSLILAGGALLGIWKGAVYAAGRLSAQLAEERSLSEERLDAEAVRLQMQLDAEAERLRRQLEHDRWMREVEELRRLIDEAAAAGLEAANAVHEIREPLHLELDAGESGEEVEARRRSANTGVQGMQGFVERLELRLGRGHRLPGTYSEWQSAIEQALEELVSVPASKEHLREGGKLLTISSARYLKFMDAAQDYVRLDPPGEGSGNTA